MSAVNLLRASSDNLTGGVASATGLAPPSGTALGPAQQLYRNLTAVSPTLQARNSAKHFLQQQLQAGQQLPCDMPMASSALMAWVESSAEQIGIEYRQYLEGRQQGHSRSYFRTRSEALTYLQRIAPTKLVDGAWLYGTLKHWQNPRCKPLIATYLEELGEGDPQFNHVLLYRKLLADSGCEVDLHALDLSDDLYRQGAIQLALAYNAEEFLPEIIGYNLGYEKLPLHLLITAYELKELGLDPYYFTLHVTTDNASNGHAHKAVESVLQALPPASAAVASQEQFLRRVRAGYQLNELGPSARVILDSFDLDQQVVTVLQRKSRFGKNMHSDYCRVGGQTVNQWLAKPESIPDFLAALEKYGWIKRHENPERSRFWQMIEGDKPVMFGVFTAYEAQLLYDWIAGDWPGIEPRGRNRKMADKPKEVNNKTHVGAALQSRQTGLNTTDEFQRLVELMSPAQHYLSEGIHATRLYKQLFEMQV